MSNPKDILRKQLRSAYSDLGESYRSNADARIIQRLNEFAPYRQCNRIFLYASVGTEVHTRDLIHVADMQGKTVALPKCEAKGIMEFFLYDGELSIGRFGIPEPKSNCSIHPERNDLMIVPGLAFTRDGVRMGQGGGYYDRYLEKYPCVTIGLCRDCFIQKEIPTEWNDLPVDYVITETMVYERKNGAS